MSTMLAVHELAHAFVAIRDGATLVELLHDGESYAIINDFVPQSLEQVLDGMIAGIIGELIHESRYQPGGVAAFINTMGMRPALSSTAHGSLDWQMLMLASDEQLLAAVKRVEPYLREGLSTMTDSDLLISGVAAAIGRMTMGEKITLFRRCKERIAGPVPEEARNRK